MNWGILGLALCSFACESREMPQLEPLEVDVVITGLEGFDDIIRPHLAIAWTLSSAVSPRFYVTQDTPLDDSGAATVQFTLPPPEIVRRASPTEPLSLNLREVTSVLIHRPRLVVYDDTNGDSELSVAPDSSDRILGIDVGDTGVAAILDVEGLLRKLPLDASEAYYSATRGHYTAFIPVGVNGSAPYVLEKPLPLTVSLEASSLPGEVFKCGRPTIEWETMHVDVSLDDSIEPTLCELLYGNCVLADFGTIQPPEIAPVDRISLWREAQCRISGTLESLVVLERSVACSQLCSCKRTPLTRAYVTPKSNLPQWWPCGAAVEYCQSDLPITSFATDCLGDSSDEPNGG